MCIEFVVENCRYGPRVSDDCDAAPKAELTKTAHANTRNARCVLGINDMRKTYREPGGTVKCARV